MSELSLDVISKMRLCAQTNNGLFGIARRPSFFHAVNEQCSASPLNGLNAVTAHKIDIEMASSQMVGRTLGLLL